MSTLNRCASICRFFDRLVTHVIYASTLALKVCYGTPRASWIRPTGDPESRGRPPGHTLVELCQSPFVIREIRGGRLCEGWCDTEIIAMGLSYVSGLMDETSARERLANRRHLPTTENLIFFAIPEESSGVYNYLSGKIIPGHDDLGYQRAVPVPRRRVIVEGRTTAPHARFFAPLFLPAEPT
jgi:hypothetical protein